jgi:hypothetical protein
MADRPMSAHLGPFLAARAQPLVGRDQRHHRRKRHLEARIEQALRPHQQDRQRGERHMQRHGGPVEHHRQEHDGDHDVGAHGGEGGARDHEVAERTRHRSPGRPLLDGIAQGDGGHRGQRQADAEEHCARHDHHVQAGDGEDVEQTRIAEGLVGRFRDAAALSRD